MTLPSQSAGHTPGPWTLQDNSDDEMAYFIIEAGGKNWPDGFHLAGVIGEADARLIARAPNLLAENYKLKGQLEEAVAGLESASDMIAGEFCSHDGECSADKETCYIQEYLSLISKLKEAGS